MSKSLIAQVIAALRDANLLSYAELIVDTRESRVRISFETPAGKEPEDASDWLDKATKRINA